MIVEVMNIIAGLVLAAGIMTSIPAVGKDIARLAKWLGRFQTIIGIIAIIVAVVYFSLLQGTVAIIAGLIQSWGYSQASLQSEPALRNWRNGSDDSKRL